MYFPPDLTLEIACLSSVEMDAAKLIPSTPMLIAEEMLELEQPSTQAIIFKPGCCRLIAFTPASPEKYRLPGRLSEKTRISEGVIASLRSTTSKEVASDTLGLWLGASASFAFAITSKLLSAIVIRVLPELGMLSPLSFLPRSSC
jgi:hypothetical protein